MSCSLEHDQTIRKPKKQDYCAAEIVVIHIFVDDKLNQTEMSSLYRLIWKFFEDQCNPPKGLTID